MVNYFLAHVLNPIHYFLVFQIETSSQHHHVLLVNDIAVCTMTLDAI